ncbi:MAG: LytR/AlgR family response regulator transcription factor [Candidatus Limivicinus sp.]
MLKIAICDEEARHLCYAAELVGREISAQRAEIEGFLSPRALLRAVSSGAYTPDIAILDFTVTSAKASARRLRVARELNRLLPCCRIFFLAGYLGAAQEAGESEHQLLSLRDHRDQQARNALRQAVKTQESHFRRTSIIARAAGKTTVISLEDILYVERWGRKCRIVTGSGECTASQRPEELLLNLEHAFVHCHQGYWVNLARISSHANNEFCLDDGSRIPISRTYCRQARARFFAYLKE